MLYRLGLPMWSHKPWVGSFFSQDALASDYLEQYASVFGTVEGNTSFYAIPSEAAVQAWDRAAPESFRFSFKMPKLITHELKLERCDLSVTRFFEAVQPLQNRMGPVMIQLPPNFDGQSLDILKSFLRKLPANDFTYAVEVRHLDFFDRDNFEPQLNELLARQGIDRVCFDSRALFDSPHTDEATLDAKSKKPNLPVHARAIADQPIVRFIGHTELSENEMYFADWVAKITQWIEKGKQPYIFVHLADNTQAPKLALQLHQQLQKSIAQLPDLPEWPVERESAVGQIGLF